MGKSLGRKELGTFKKMQKKRPVRLKVINGQYSGHIKMLDFYPGYNGNPTELCAHTRWKIKWNQSVNRITS